MEGIMKLAIVSRNPTSSKTVRRANRSCVSKFERSLRQPSPLQGEEGGLSTAPLVPDGSCKRQAALAEIAEPTPRPPATGLLKSAESTSQASVITELTVTQRIRELLHV